MNLKLFLFSRIQNCFIIALCDIRTCIATADPRDEVERPQYPNHMRPPPPPPPNPHTATHVANLHVGIFREEIFFAFTEFSSHVPAFKHLEVLVFALPFCTVIRTVIILKHAEKLPDKLELYFMGHSSGWERSPFYLS